MKINDGCVLTVIGAIYRQANGENTLKRNRVFLLLNRWSLPLKISITYYIGIWTGHKGHPKNFLIGLKIVKNTLLWFVLNLEIFRKKKLVSKSVLRNTLNRRIRTKRFHPRSKKPESKRHLLHSLKIRPENHTSAHTAQWNMLIEPNCWNIVKVHKFFNFIFLASFLA